LSAKLYLESSTADTDVLLVLRAFAPDGTEVVFQGGHDPHTPIAQGWLRASHRALDQDQSRPFLPVHTHDHAEPLTPGVVYELDVEIWPTSLIVPEGYRLTLDVQGHDDVHPGATPTNSRPLDRVRTVPPQRCRRPTRRCLRRDRDTPHRRAIRLPPPAPCPSLGEGVNRRQLAGWPRGLSPLAVRSPPEPVKDDEEEP
jgi:predicted acyl esterase